MNLRQATTGALLTMVHSVQVSFKKSIGGERAENTSPQILQSVAVTV